MRGRERSLWALLAVLLAVSGGAGLSGASFNSTSSNPGAGLAAAPDFERPTLGSAVIAKATGGVSGYIREGGQYAVYANVTDGGNPASGVGTVVADVSSITGGQTGLTLSPGSYSVGGVSYTHRSGLVTADSPLAAGTRSFSVSATDNDANGPVANAFSVDVDNTAPAAADVQAANAGGGQSGLAQTGDTITYSFSEAVDPESVLAGWTGASTTVRVQIADNTANDGQDTLTIRSSDGSVQLPLGSVNLMTNHISSGTATFTGSTMQMTGSTVTVTLGTPTGSAVRRGAGANMVWSPSTAVYDGAGNAMSAAARTEGTPPGNDRDF